MRNNRIYEAWSKLAPDGRANDRMLSSILEENRRINGHSDKTACAVRGHYEKNTLAPAAVCLAVIAAAAFIVSLGRPRSGPGPVVSDNDRTEMRFETSGTYHSLDRLLSYLSIHDSHNSRQSDGTGVGPSENNSRAVSYDKYIYSISGDLSEVRILGADNKAIIGNISKYAERLFICGDRLICVSGHDGIETDSEPEQLVEIFSLEYPEKPMLVDSFIQSGSLTAAYMTGSQLYLLTSDGVCACGWSRLKDTSGYIPKLLHGDTALEWPESEICILGEPTSVEYIAVSIIDVPSAQVISKQAFYGNITKSYYGGGWLAFTVCSRTEKTQTHPEVYTFDTADGFSFTGKLSTAELFSLEKTVKLKNGKRPDGIYPSIVSLTKHNESYRVIGSVNTISDDKNEQSFLALTMDTKTGEVSHSALDASDYPYASYDEILWEDDRAILSVSTMYNLFSNDLETVNRFIFVDFSGTDIRFFENALKADHVSGVDMMYYYGNPLGNIESLIPLGNGIYLRYNEKPDGLDIYDFSDSADPVCLYKAENMLPEGCRFEFENAVYENGDIIGIKVISPNENGDYRNITCSWHVYSVDPFAQQPFSLVNQYRYIIDE